MKNAQKTHDTPLRRTQRILDGGLGRLEGAVEDAGRALASSDSVRDAEAFARLLVRVAEVGAEIRKGEAAERKAADAIETAAVLEWYRSMAPVERGRVLRELEEIERSLGKSGLA